MRWKYIHTIHCKVPVNALKVVHIHLGHLSVGQHKIVGHVETPIAKQSSRLILEKILLQ